MADEKIKIIILGIDRASGPLRGVTKRLQGLGRAALMASGGAIAGLGAIGAGIIKLTINAASLSQVRAAFDGIAQSAGTSGDAMLESLKKASGGMVDTQTLMQNFNNAAQLVSTDFAKKLPSAMGYLQKVSAATGTSMDYMLNSLVTGVGRLSPMILDNLGIQVKLSEATATASHMFGVQADKLTKAQIQAGMMNVVLKKLHDNTAAMPDVTNTAAAATARLKTMFTDTRNAIGEALVPSLNELMTTIEPLVQSIIPGLTAAIGQVGQFIFSLIPYILTGVRAFIAFASVVKSYQGAVQGIFAQIGQWIQWRDVLIALGIAIGSVVIPALVSAVIAALPVILTIGALIGAVALLRRHWTDALVFIHKVTGTVFGSITKYIQGVGSWLVKFWGKVTALTSKIWTTGLDWIKKNVWSKLTAVGKFLGRVMLSYIHIYAVGWKAIGGVFIKALTAIAGVVGNAMANIAESIASLFDRIPKIGPGIAASIRGAEGAIRGAANAVTGSVRDSLTGKLNDLVDGTEGKITGLLKNLPDMAKSVKDSFVAKLKDLVAKGGDALAPFKNKLGDVIDAIKKFAGKGKAGFNGFKDFLGDFIAQIRAKMGDMKDAIKPDDLAKNIEDTLAPIFSGVDKAGKKAGKGARDALQKSFADIKKDAAKAFALIDFQLKLGIMKPIAALQAKIGVLKGVLKEAFTRGLTAEAKKAGDEIKWLQALLDKLTGSTKSADTATGRAVQTRHITINANIATTQPTRDVVRDLRILQGMVGG